MLDHPLNLELKIDKKFMARFMTKGKFSFIKDRKKLNFAVNIKTTREFIRLDDTMNGPTR